jgi:hypothetical protein
VKLAELQRTFFSVASGEREAPPELLELLAIRRGASPARRLQVYTDTVRLKPVEGLGVPFSKVEALVGAQRFEEIVDAHRVSYPRQRRTLDNLLRDLPRFLDREGARWGRPDLGALADLELARYDVSTEADSAAATADALAELTEDEWPAAALSFIPALRLVNLSFDVSGLWQRLDDDEPPPPPVAAPTSIVTWRAGFAVCHSVVEAAEAEALARARARAPLTEVCESFAERPEPDEAAYAALHGWFADGFVEAVLRAPLPEAPLGGGPA